MLVIYYGDNASKNALCTGAALTAAEKEWGVLYVRFGSDTDGVKSPLFGIRNITEITSPIRFSLGGLDGEQLSQLSRIMRELFENAVRQALTSACGLLILDDIFDIADAGLLPQSEIYDFLSNAPDRIQVICTGRKADEKFLKLADRAVELRLVEKEEDTNEAE